jgi:TRAP-type transport system small permease protein
MSKLEKIDRALSSVGAGLAAMAIILSIAMVVVGVIARYVFNMAVIFIDEYTGYSLVLTTFMGLAYTLRTEGHIDVDLLVSHFPPRVKSWFRAVTTLLALGLAALLTFYTGGRTWSSYQMGSVATSPLETPLFIPQLCIPIGFGLLTLSLLAYFARVMRSIRTGEGEEKHGH